MDAFQLLVSHRGHHPGDRVRLTPLAGAQQLGRELGPDAIILINLSRRVRAGRRDRDPATSISSTCEPAAPA